MVRRCLRLYDTRRRLTDRVKGARVKTLFVCTIPRPLFRPINLRTRYCRALHTTVYPFIFTMHFYSTYTTNQSWWIHWKYKYIMFVVSSLQNKIKSVVVLYMMKWWPQHAQQYPTLIRTVTKQHLMRFGAWRPFFIILDGLLPFVLAILAMAGVWLLLLYVVHKHSAQRGQVFSSYPAEEEFRCPTRCVDWVV